MGLPRKVDAEHALGAQALYSSGFAPSFVDPMADARRVRAERKVARVVVTALAVPGSRRHCVGVEAVATDPVACEFQASFVHPSMQREGLTATTYSSCIRLERVNTQAALLMVRELLHYRPADVGYDT
ncbi:hypothetical protein D1007_25342 [Hordeum vulgare]|nr:hypothetical protein D1007_25342 [Hordeum vulgare]